MHRSFTYRALPRIGVHRASGLIPYPLHIGPPYIRVFIIDPFKYRTFAHIIVHVLGSSYRPFVYQTSHIEVFHTSLPPHRNPSHVGSIIIEVLQHRNASHASLRPSRSSAHRSLRALHISGPSRTSRSPCTAPSQHTRISGPASDQFPCSHMNLIRTSRISSSV